MLGMVGRVGDTAPGFGTRFDQDGTRPVVPQQIDGEQRAGKADWRMRISIYTDPPSPRVVLARSRTDPIGAMKLLKDCIRDIAAPAIVASPASNSPEPVT